MGILEDATRIAQQHWGTANRAEAATKQVQHLYPKYTVFSTDEYHCHPGHLTWIVIIQLRDDIQAIFVKWDEELREYLIVSPV